MEEETLDPEVLNSDENLDSNQETEGEDLNAKLSKAEEIAKNQRIRAEKAEQELKALKKPVQTEKETPKNDNISFRDIRALQDVADEDVDEVINFAKFKGISIAEAKASPVIQTLLKTNTETRKTAQATQVKTNGRSFSKSNDDKILEDFENGIMPEDPTELSKARYNAILKKRKN